MNNSPGKGKKGLATLLSFVPNHVCMTPIVGLTLLGAYFALLIVISRFTSRGGSNADFFAGSKQSPWYVVAFGMIGASLSGVTFISVPGWVAGSAFSYMQMVLGYLVGYLVIGTILLPLYYRLNLTTIYGYLQQRFGQQSYLTGAGFFLLSRTLGSAFRLFIVASVLDLAIFGPLGLPFWASSTITIVLIWVYTYRGGIKTIVWTDTLQTLFLLLAVVLTIVAVMPEVIPTGESLWTWAAGDARSQVFFWDDVSDARFFPRQFISGAFIALAMTGLDQDMMQKNLTCRSLKDAQKNMLWFSVSLVFVNLLFLVLGLLLTQYAEGHGIALSGDQLFPGLALDGTLGMAVAVFFMIGLVAAAYSSADSALAALTTSFCVDFLGMTTEDTPQSKRTRVQVHLGISLVMALLIVAFKYVVSENVIREVFIVAGYTYGPLLGLFFFGLYTKRTVRDRWVPALAIAAPVLTYGLNAFMQRQGWGALGFEAMLVNAGLTWLFLYLASIGEVPAPGERHQETAG